MLRLKIYIDRKKAEIKRRNDDIKSARNVVEVRRLEAEKKKAETLLKADVALHDEYIKSRNMFLSQAIEMWSLCLTGSDTYDDDAVVRLCSLWFANFDTSEGDLPAKIGTALARISSRKFVFLAHQLAARLSDSETVGDMPSNQRNLRSVIARMCKDHPFHSLFPVYCLRSDAPQGKSSRQSLSQSSQVVRATAASSIFAQLRADPSCSKRISDVEMVCDASLQFAKWPIKAMVTSSQKRKPSLDVAPHLAIRKLSKVQVPVVTAHTPLDPTCRYDDCVWIAHYETRFDTAGGVNMPKIIRCIGTDGNKYKQLVSISGTFYDTSLLT